MTTVANRTAADLELTHLIGLRPGVDVVPSGADEVELRHPWGRHTLRGLSIEDVDLLRLLARNPVDAVELIDGRLRRALLSLANLVTVTIGRRGGEPLVVTTPINRRAGLIEAQLVDAGTARLSRFAYLRRLPDATGTGDELILESPLSNHRIAFPDPAVAAFVAALVGNAEALVTADRVGLSRDMATLVLAVLAGAGLLEDPSRDARLELWEFHDLLFHTRSRYGLHDYNAGGVFAHPDAPHAPPLPHHDGTAAVDLDRPDFASAVAADPSLTEALENRRSLRTYATAPITLGELSEFLYRTARARRVVQSGGEHPYVGVDRPYPLGGGLGELELYVVVHECDGLGTGVYWYDSAAHRLVLRSTDAGARHRLATQAWLATGGNVDRPQVQLCITSRLERVQWKYSAIAYSVTLKHVGVLLQTLYLVATAMGLSPCANGSGDTDAVARAIGVDWTAEPPVGEFLLGGAPATTPVRVDRFVDVVDETRAG
jgi:SagB-type dehydrogenase family enzyme